ncbi:MAG: hypothetical protein ACE5NC_01690 [Anaerolineae bacterium]
MKNRRPMGWRGTIGFGLILIVFSLFAFAIATGTLPAESVGLEAPPWIAALVGGILGLFGALILFTGMSEREGGSGPWAELLSLLQPWAVALIITLFAIVGGWIAFGPGEREFEGGLSLFFIEIEGPSPEFEGRCAFGLGAVLAGLIAAYAWFDALRGWYRGRADEPDQPSSSP